MCQRAWPPTINGMLLLKQGSWLQSVSVGLHKYSSGI